MPYAGELSEVNRDMLLECPKAKTSGEYSMFEIQTPDAFSGHVWKWMTLPNWPPLAKAKQPVALLIKNCSKIAELRSSIRAKVWPIHDPD